MPIDRELKPYYGYHWRTVTRPRILRRARNHCERCGGWWPHGRGLEVAHLKLAPPHPRHDTDENLAALCARCHKRHDYQEWARKSWLTRTRRKDAARPLLEVGA